MKNPYARQHGPIGKFIPRHHNPTRYSGSHCRPRPINAAAIKAAIRPADFYADQLVSMPPPRRSKGWHVAGLCPNPDHHDTRPGSFLIHLEKGAAKCYACGFYASDILDFYCWRHGVTFREAIEQLSKEWSVYT